MTTVELTTRPWQGTQRAHTMHSLYILVVFNEFLLVTKSCDAFQGATVKQPESPDPLSTCW